MGEKNMPRVAREKSESGIYHVIIRSANRQEVELFQKYNEQENNDNYLDDVATNKVSCLWQNKLH